MPGSGGHWVVALGQLGCRSGQTCRDYLPCANFIPSKAFRRIVTNAYVPRRAGHPIGARYLRAPEARRVGRPAKLKRCSVEAVHASGRLNTTLPAQLARLTGFFRAAPCNKMVIRCVLGFIGQVVQTEGASLSRLAYEILPVR